MKGILVLLFGITIIPFAFAEEFPDLGVKVETVADNLTIPWSIDWLPSGDAIFTERNGNLRIIQNGELQEIPLLSLSVAGVEGGMLGVAVDPNYSENNFIYLYYTYNEFLSTQNKLVRYHYSDKVLTENKILLDGIPGGPFHDGGRIQFGPDGKLYITTGDAGDPNLSQDLNSLAGKILRINSDGTIPEDNPWNNSLIYSIGHRNPQGIDWDNDGNLVATEHGPSGWRGSAHDELNLIIPGSNYGWPDVIGDEVLEGAINPILHTGDDTWAPSGGEFYEGEKISHWTGKYFVATLRGSHLHMIDFDIENNKVISNEKLFQDDFGRLRDVQTGPDGYLYILTSNQDGRGFPNSGDDKILRIMPLNPINDCNVTKENPIEVSAISEIENGITKIKVVGCVDEIAKFKGINLEIIDPNGKFVTGGAVVPQEDGKFERTFEKEVSINGTYSVIADANGEFAVTNTFVVPEFGQIIVIILIISIVGLIASTRLFPNFQFLR
ncbi:sorbosone dehydrogenase family protein [Nitrosopumilus sp.]|uniref:PQQ-dependent sugar dehydrogenase n=1 Tax=Nitrosopumilus sp. TaxID=2024843 RepID=UPI002615A767|nr:PQQ-dependent sugar dehydrogenase [Nitrosopumilus sp.]